MKHKLEKLLTRSLNKSNKMKKILIGKIISPFGIKGEVKILSFCEQPEQIASYPLFYHNNQPLKLKLKSQKPIGSNKNGEFIFIAKIDGVNNRNESEKLRGAEIFVNRDDFSENEDGEFYYVDLIGLDVIDETEKTLGKVINIYDHGAGGIVEIEFSKADPKKHLEKIENFPFKDEIFPEVNLKENFIRIALPEINLIK